MSAYYNITHGHGLAIVTPRRLTNILEETAAHTIAGFGVKVFGLEENPDKTAGAKAAINELSDFCFKTLGLKSTLADPGIDGKHFKAMAEHACMGGENLQNVFAEFNF